MTTLKVAGSASPIPRIDTALRSDTWQNHMAQATAEWGGSGAVIRVRGELDAANAGELADHVLSCANHCSWLVLDLHDLDFMGTTGFAALQTINTWCRNAEISWSMVPGPAVSRLLDICDPGRALPTAGSVAVALGRVQVRRRTG